MIYHEIAWIDSFDISRHWQWPVFPASLMPQHLMLHFVVASNQDVPPAPAAEKAVWSGIFTSHDSFSWCQQVMVCSEGTQICGYLSKSWEVMGSHNNRQDMTRWDIMKYHEIASFDSPDIGNGKYFLPLWCLNIWCYLFLWPPTRRYDRLQLLRRPCDLGISSISSHHLTFSQIGNGWYFHVFPAFLMP